MARLVVLYKMPADPAAFDAYYFGKHIPIAKKIPGLKSYDVSKGPVMTPQGPSQWHLIATLHFNAMADIAAAFASPEGQAAAGDLANFADGGAEMVMHDDMQV